MQPTKIVKVVAVFTKPKNACSYYWLKLENHQEIPCTEGEYFAARQAINTGGFHAVSVKR